MKQLAEEKLKQIQNLLKKKSDIDLEIEQLLCPELEAGLAARVDHSPVPPPPQPTPTKKPSAPPSEKKNNRTKAIAEIAKMLIKGPIKSEDTQELADKYGVSTASIYNWITKARSEGVSEDVPIAAAPFTPTPDEPNNEGVANKIHHYKCDECKARWQARISPSLMRCARCLIRATLVP